MRRRVGDRGIYVPVAGDEILKICRATSIADVVTHRYHRWVGHAARMRDVELPKEQTEADDPPGCRRRRGGQFITSIIPEAPSSGG